MFEHKAPASSKSNVVAVGTTTGRATGSTERSVLVLQRGIGNAATARILAGRTLAHLPSGVQRSVEGEGAVGRRPNLDVGDEGPGVALLQKRLGLKVSRTFDSTTHEAVVAFQQARPALHPATGGVGRLTWEALDEAAGLLHGEGSVGRRPNLDLGDRGRGVALLQTRLGIHATGFFDVATQKAVVAYQEARPDLHPATGGVGQLTWAALDRQAGVPSSSGDSARTDSIASLRVDGRDLGEGRMQYGAAGAIVVGGSQLARGVATFGQTALGGGAETVVISAGTDTVIVGAAGRALAADGAAILASEATVVSAPAVAAPGAAVGTAPALAGAAAVGFVLIGAIVVGGATLLVAYAVSQAMSSPPRVELPPGGVPEPAFDPGANPPAATPGLDGGAPAQAPGAQDAGPALAPGGIVDDPAECAKQVKSNVTHDHHIFPQTLREEFLRIGIEIDQYTITIPSAAHIGPNGVHTALNWNDHWHVFFDDLPDRELTETEKKRWREKAIQEAIDLLWLAKMQDLPVHPWKLKL